ncbi:MAG TPA: class I SAM-dependent methyltransferase [Thermomicrobiaceae bacterium]|nr:class I SAM-dependent methyltransferase [Thermomicrobiaceae bacterium]
MGEDNAPERQSPDAGLEPVEDVATFYDHLTADYHLVYADWRDEAVPRQGRVLDQLIQRELGPGTRRVLDCTCGIGTQALGLALRGHQVRASDISPAAVQRAAREAIALGVSLATSVADVRRLAASVAGAFDVVLSCDNSLPHLPTAADVRLAVAQMAAKLRPGGLLVIGIRDYDRLPAERPRATLPQVRDDLGGRSVYFQVWDWAPDGEQYTMHLFILRERAGTWQTTHHSTRYRALRRGELEEALVAAGLHDIRWHEPVETGHHQPLVTARAV